MAGFLCQLHSLGQPDLSFLYLNILFCLHRRHTKCFWNIKDYCLLCVKANCVGTKKTKEIPGSRSSSRHQYPDCKTRGVWASQAAKNCFPLHGNSTKITKSLPPTEQKQESQYQDTKTYACQSFCRDAVAKYIKTTQIHLFDKEMNRDHIPELSDMCALNLKP